MRVDQIPKRELDAYVAVKDRSEIAAGYVLHAYCGVCRKCGIAEDNPQTFAEAKRYLIARGWRILKTADGVIVRCPKHNPKRSK